MLDPQVSLEFTKALVASSADAKAKLARICDSLSHNVQRFIAKHILWFLDLMDKDDRNLNFYQFKHFLRILD